MWNDLKKQGVKFVLCFPPHYTQSNEKVDNFEHQQIPSNIEEQIEALNNRIDEYHLDYSKERNTDDAKHLTEEEMIALRLKWGKTYRPEEWIKLE